MYSDRSSATTAAAVNNTTEISTNKSSNSCRSITAQCIAMIPPIALTATFGVSMGYATVLIPELYKNNTEVVITLDELTWISSMNYFLTPLGAIVSGPLLDLFGRRSLMMLSSVIFVAAWIVFYGWGTNAWALLTGFALTGIASGIVDTSCQIYVSEIAELRLRGTMMTSLTVAISIGICMQILINMYVSLRTLALFNIVCPALALIVTFLLPESPHWLISKGRTKVAERALRWLRGWTDSVSVQSEYNLLIESCSPNSKNNLDSSGRRSLMKLYLRREFLLPFALLSFCFVLTACNGGVSIMTFSVLVFEKLESPIDEYTATLIFSILQLMAAVLLMLIVHSTGKRKPTLASLIGTSFAMFAITIYVFLKDLKIIHKESSHSWVPMMLLLFSAFIMAAGIRCTPYFFANEMFSVQVKSIAVGLLLAWVNLLYALASKSFLYQLELLTLPGTFLFFALVNLLGFVILYWTLPETEDKTFAEIEKYFTKKTSRILVNQ